MPTNAGVRFLVSFGVPLALLFFGGLGRLLIVTEFRWGHFFLGPDFALAGFTVGLLNFIDVADSPDNKQLIAKVLWTLGYSVITFGIYMVLLCMHQNIEKRQTKADDRHANAVKVAEAKGVDPPKKQEEGKKLGMLANVVGLAPSFLFAWLKLKGSL